MTQENWSQIYLGADLDDLAGGQTKGALHVYSVALQISKNVFGYLAHLARVARRECFVTHIVRHFLKVNR